MQPTEAEGQIFIVVIDETYGGIDEDHEANSEAYRKTIEREFGAEFTEANVGPGADIPAFLTIIATTSVPLWSVLLGAFFLGKPISENLDGWIDLGRKVRSFFGRPVVLARHGAAVLAVEAVFDELGGVPKTVKLLGYRTGHSGDEDNLKSLEPCLEIGESVPTLYLGYATHIFEIEADELLFRVSVSGKETKVYRLD